MYNLNMKFEPFIISRPGIVSKPILISVPHSGIRFPHEVSVNIKKKFLERPEDTDWFVHQLYDFCTEMGMIMIMAPLSRYVIDLNRSDNGELLYSDSRAQSNLVPTKSFKQETLYSSSEPDENEVSRRIIEYYNPYYNRVDSILSDLENKFGHSLLFDCHSIARNVPSIQKEDFPDMILGSNDERSADKSIIQIAMDVLNACDYEVSHNAPFKGGHITRHFGTPEKHRHALQLEMSQDVYMDTENKIYSPFIRPSIRPVLKELFEQINQVMENLNS
jgi:N-formylglutamate deformylase